LIALALWENTPATFIVSRYQKWTPTLLSTNSTATDHFVCIPTYLLSYISTDPHTFIPKVLYM